MSIVKVNAHYGDLLEKLEEARAVQTNAGVLAALDDVIKTLEWMRDETVEALA
tara:strand:+ start:3580 stop:3738 length:159 start_codon:yes stop_codon:yes gene_type:complete